jgi:hypothetical protein
MNLPILVKLTVTLLFLGGTAALWALLAVLTRVVAGRDRRAGHSSWDIRVGFLAFAVELFVAVAWMGFRSVFTAVILLALVVFVLLISGWLVFAESYLPTKVRFTICVSLITLSAVFLCASASISWPLDIPVLARPLALRLAGRADAKRLPPPGQTLTLVHRAASYRDLRNKLLPTPEGGLGSLKLDGSTLVFDSGLESPSLMLDSLELTNGSRLITNGNSLHIQVNRLISNGGSIIAFDDYSPPKKAALGIHGINGASGGKVVLEVEELTGKLNVDLSGKDGGAGGDGLPGFPGGPGRRGDEAADSWLGCAHGGGNGEQGSPGTPGGAGSAGGDGGDGGGLVLRGAIRRQANAITFRAQGGVPGDGGDGGPGGTGGQGGQGGSGSAFCRGGEGGPMGPNGDHGAPGSRGSPGHNGAMSVY